MPGRHAGRYKSYHNLEKKSYHNLNKKVTRKRAKQQKRIKNMLMIATKNPGKYNKIRGPLIKY